MHNKSNPIYKTVFTLTIATFLSIQTKAQPNFSYSEYAYNPGRGMIDQPVPTIGYSTMAGLKVLADADVSEVKIIRSTSKKSKIKVNNTIMYEYNDSNLIIDYSWYNDSEDHLYFGWKYWYDTSGNIVQRDRLAGAKKKSSTIQEFRNGLLTEYKEVKGEKVLVSFQFSYTEGNKLQEQRKYKKERLKETWTHSYYDNGSKKEIKHQNSKGKIKHIWSFDCSDEGIEKVKHKDTSSTSNNKTLNEDGSYTEVLVTKNEKGKLTKIVRTYNKADWLVSEKVTQGVDDEFIRSISYTYKQDTILTAKNFISHFGKQLHNWQEEYNAAGRIRKKEYFSTKKGKTAAQRKTTYVYNANGLLEREEESSSENKKTRVRTVEYTFRP
ncbi:MAG: hypothetical protein ACI83I_002216 [Bacteroidia bacterium]|jgi:hypothetical protein